jgi:uncharacterized radical SAM superfamily Fe-S cluster-containing enzyme
MKKLTFVAVGTVASLCTSKLIETGCDRMKDHKVKKNEKFFQEQYEEIDASSEKIWRTLCNVDRKDLMKCLYTIHDYYELRVTHSETTLWAQHFMDEYKAAITKMAKVCYYADKVDPQLEHEITYWFDYVKAKVNTERHDATPFYKNFLENSKLECELGYC